MTRFDSRVPAGLRFRGRINGPGGLEVFGVVEGDITIDGTLRIAAGATVSGEVRAGRVELEGSFEGLALASEWLRVGRGAVFQGLGVAPQTVVHQDAQVDGELREQSLEALASTETLMPSIKRAPALETEAEEKPRRVRRRRRRRSTPVADQTNVAKAGKLGKMPRLTGMKVRRAREDHPND